MFIRRLVIVRHQQSILLLAQQQSSWKLYFGASANTCRSDAHCFVSHKHLFYFPKRFQTSSSNNSSEEVAAESKQEQYESRIQRCREKDVNSNSNDAEEQRVISPSTHRKFFDDAAIQLGVKAPEDWYKITSKQLRQLKNAGIIRNHYNDSIHKALTAQYPEQEWIPWQFSRVPLGFWKDPANHRRFFDWAAEKLAITTWEDWYAVSCEQITQLGGGGLLNEHYKDSVQRALAAVYPEHEWLPWRFKHVPSSFWKSDLSAPSAAASNHRLFFDWASKQLGIETMDDWYAVSVRQISDLGGAGLLASCYGNSLKKALAAVYPEHDWLPWRFSHASSEYWKHGDRDTHKRFFDWAATKLGVQQMEDWYDVALERIKSFGGSGLLQLYNNSLHAALSAVYPHHRWLPWRFSTVPKDFWKDQANCRAFLAWASDQLGLNATEDWYAVAPERIRRLGGGALLRNHHASLLSVLASAYPSYDWLPWRFEHLPPRFWRDEPTTTHRRFFDWAAPQLGIKSLEDWYKITLAQVKRLGVGGAAMLSTCYNDSLLQALSAAYPEYEFVPWRFVEVPHGFSFEDRSNHKWFFDWAARQLGFETKEGWYTATVAHIQQLGGMPILRKHYNSSLQQALASIYPDHEWLPWRFKQVSKSFWKDKANHKLFLDWAAKELSLETLDDWYDIKIEQVFDLGGGGLLRMYYDTSLQKALSAVYPDHEWQVWRFNYGSVAAGATEPALRRFIEHIATELQIKHLDDWYRVSLDEVRQIGSVKIIEQRGGLYPVLQRLYPEHPWDATRFGHLSIKKASQRQLCVALTKLFPNEAILEEHRAPASMFFAANPMARRDGL